MIRPMRCLCLFHLVSNPIREYLQILILLPPVYSYFCFKPYKGVSSNKETRLKKAKEKCFKPYKGVSSNLLI